MIRLSKQRTAQIATTGPAMEKGFHNRASGQRCPAAISSPQRYPKGPRSTPRSPSRHAIFPGLTSLESDQVQVLAVETDPTAWTGKEPRPETDLLIQFPATILRFILRPPLITLPGSTSCFRQLEVSFALRSVNDQWILSREPIQLRLQRPKLLPTQTLHLVRGVVGESSGVRENNLFALIVSDWSRRASTT